MKAKQSWLIIFLVSTFVSCLRINHVMADTKVQLKPCVATYMVTAMGLEGINVTNSLSIGSSINSADGEKQAYHFKSYSMPVGLLAFKKDETRDEQSEGLILDGNIRPDKYSYLQIRDNKTRLSVEIIFDW